MKTLSALCTIVLLLANSLVFAVFGDATTSLSVTGRKALSVSTHGQGKPFVPPTLLAGEATTVETFSVKLAGFVKFAKQIQRTPRPSKKALARLSVMAEQLKKDVPSYKDSIASVIEKIKTAGKWTDEYDAFMERRITDSGIQAAVKSKLLASYKQEGGARAVLTKTLGQADNLPQKIDRIVDLVSNRKTGNQSGANTPRTFHECSACSALAQICFNKCGTRRHCELTCANLAFNCFHNCIDEF